MRHAARFTFALFACAVLAGASTAAAAAPDLAAVERACKPGTDPQQPGADSHTGGFFKGGGKTPATLPGAVTVSPREAKCLMDSLGERLVVIQAMHDSNQLPRAQQLSEAGSSSADEGMQQRVADALARLTEGDKGRPLLVYCHHASCPMSYNASLRAVNAGYRKVFWLREGNNGWFAAGYPRKGEELDAKGLPGKYHEELRSCDSSYSYGPNQFAALAVETADDAKLDASFQAARSKAQAGRVRCIDGLKSRFAANQAVQADAAARIARSDAEVARQFQAARSAVETNPLATFKPSLEAVDTGELGDILARARSVKSLAQECGTLDASLPNSQSEVEAANQRLNAYRGCVRRVAADRSGDFDADAFVGAAKALAGVARYTCGRKPGPNCLPDASWRPAGDIATPANAQLVIAASERVDRRDDELKAAVLQIKDWLQRANAHVGEINRRIAEREANRPRSQPSYSAPVYNTPSYEPPDLGRYGTGRRDSSTSAPGIR